MRLSRHRGWALGLTGLILTGVLLAFARPREIAALVGTARWQGVALAFAWGCAVLLARGIRLSVLLAPRISVGRSTAVVAVAQCAASVLPLRLGELALPAMLELAGVRGLVRGLAYALVLRLMDMASLAVWALVAVAVAGRSALTAVVLAVVVAAAGTAGVALLRRLPALARRRRHGGRIARVVVRQVLEIRRELRGLLRSPRRALAVAVTSLAVWGGLWGLTASLLAAMGRSWPPPAVLAGVIGAAVGSSLPINAVGSFGSLEAGWTTAAVAFGIPAQQALADGFATHLWSLAFSLLLAAPALAWLMAVQSDRRPIRLLARPSTQRRNDLEP